MTEALFILVVILIAIIVGLLYLGVRAGRRIRNFEYLFTDTLDEISTAAEIFDKLVNRSSMLTDHPDIKSLQQVMLLILDILERYITYGKQFTPPQAKKEGKG